MPDENAVLRDQSTSSELDVWRRNLIRGVFRGAVAFGAVAVAVGFLATRTQFLGFFYVGIYLAFVLVIFVRPGSFRLQASACLGLLYGLGALALFEDGLKGDGRVFLLTLPVLAALLLGRKAGLAALGIALVTLGGFGGAFAAGLLTIPVEDQVVANDLLSWASGTLAWLVMGIVVVLSLNYMLSRFTSTLDESRRLAQDLEASKVTLESQVVERTQALAEQTKTLTVQARELNDLVGTQRQLLNTIREMSTPVVPLQEGIIVMPLVGMIDAERAQQVLAALLAGVEDLRARVAILDITGVPVVDEVVAHSLLQAMRASQLLGAEPILVGLRPEVAQTIVTLGVDLQQGLETAMRHTGDRLREQGKVRALHGRGRWEGNLDTSGQG
jgi:anti-anti-sigma regulatory factor